MPETTPRFDRLCTILAPVSIVDSDGAPTESFEAYRTVWCRREDRGGRERRDSGAKRSESDCLFTIRYLGVPTLTTKHRVNCEGRTYEIEALSEGGRRQFWRIFASEVEGLA